MSTRLTLSAPVGKLRLPQSAGNVAAEVKKVQLLLKSLHIDENLITHGKMNEALIAAIKRFQRTFMTAPDGRIDPKGGTLRRLNQLALGKVILVSLDRQKLFALNSLNTLYTFDCTSGSSSHRTPRGIYSIHRKHAKYRSKTYDAQMDFAMFFHRGYAIHMAHAVAVTSFLKYMGVDTVGSHGCVRLSEANARTLFKWAEFGTKVVVF